MDDDFILDDEFLDDIDTPILCNNVLENFPFIEDDIDSLTDYELFSRGFEYLDDKKADKKDIPSLENYYNKDEVDELLDEKANVSDIPDVSNFITKDVNDLTYYTKTSDLSTVATTGDYDDLLDKPTIPDVSNFITKDVNDLTYYTKTSDLSTVATTGDYDDLLDKPTIPDVSNFITKDVNDLTYYTKTSDLSTVATTGDYDDLLDKPTIPDVSNFITKDVNDLTYYTKTNDLSTVATTGDYDDLLDKPTIPDVSNFITKDVNDLTYYTKTSDLSTTGTGGTGGSYIKFADGTLIQFGNTTKNVTVNIQDSDGRYYDNSYGITLPTNFINDTYYSSVTYNNTTNHSLLVYSITGKSTSGFNFNLSSDYSYSANSVPFSWIAIGRWK